jgi:hypothetical protein
MTMFWMTMTLCNFDCHLACPQVADQDGMWSCRESIMD